MRRWCVGKACWAWSCCPTWTQVLLLFIFGNIVGDFLAFPFVHSAWNLIGFEGWWLDE